MPVITATLSFRMPELAVSLVSKGPHLDAAIDPHVLVAGVKDVRVDDQSVVDRRTRIANIPLGDGLEFQNNELNVVGGAVQFIEINSLSGEFTPAQIAALIRNKQHRIMFGSTIYYSAIRNGDRMRYQSLTPVQEFDHIDVYIPTRTYTVQRRDPTIYDDHIANRIIHITEEERQFWNDKVSCSNPDGTDIIVFTTD